MVIDTKYYPRWTILRLMAVILEGQYRLIHKLVGGKPHTECS